MEDISIELQPARWKVLLLGLFHVIWAVICGILIYQNWPDKVDLEKIDIKNYIYLVLLAGATGSFIHSAGSFISFVGAEKLKVTWFWWYILRPFLGMAVAMVFFIIFRAGLLANTKVDENPYGFLALCTLAGMFSDRATLKLAEIFEGFFSPKDERKDKLTDNGPNDKDFENPDSKG
jgi:hypothetical protein